MLQVEGKFEFDCMCTWSQGEGEGEDQGQGQGQGLGEGSGTYARERLTYVCDCLGLLGLTRPKKHGELLGG